MMRGIDVSYANGTIDWSRLRSQINFAILRSSFGSDLPGQTDNCYYHNAEGCIQNNIPFGTYHFAYFVDEKTAREEAAFAVRLANRFSGHSGMIALDIEEDSQRYAASCGMSPDWTKCACAFLEYIEAAGYRPVLYTNDNWMTNIFDYEKLKRYPLWLASPGASEDVPKRYANIVLWQNSWDGHFAGIRGDVDTDVCYDKRIFAVEDEVPSAKTSEKPITIPISQIHSSKTVNYEVCITSEDGVNIRSGAGTSYAILGAVPKGECLKVSRQTSGGGYTWGLIEYHGITGWIALNFAEKVRLKSLDTIAREVIRGDWGAGEERVRRLTAAGYNYNAVQNRVNELMS